MLAATTINEINNPHCIDAGRFGDIWIPTSHFTVKKKKKFSSTVQKENVQGQLESHVYNVSVPK